jgi:hypothetical protein
MRNRFRGRRGVIRAVKENRYSPTLDKYVVQFEEADQEVFWDIELKRPEIE